MPYRYIDIHTKQVMVRMKNQPRFKVTDIAAATGTSTRTVMRVNKLFREEHIVARPLAQPRCPRSLNTFHVNYIESLIDRTPDLYLWEVTSMFNNAFKCNISESTVRREMKRRGLTYKMVTRPAREANEAARESFKIRMSARYEPRQLVFCDETGHNRLTYRRTHAWSRSGTRARRHDVFLRGKRYSMLPAISLDGLLHIDVIDRPFNGRLFEDFVDGLLDKMNPYPGDNSVLVMDNASIHKTARVRELVENRGMKLEYLPSYSPDFDPLEEGFSAIKACLRRNRDHAHIEMLSQNELDIYMLLFDVAYETLTPENIWGWYYDSGYV